MADRKNLLRKNAAKKPGASSKTKVKAKILKAPPKEVAANSQNKVIDNFVFLNHLIFLA